MPETMLLIQMLILLLVIGGFAGVLAGLLGVGGGIVGLDGHLCDDGIWPLE